MKAKVCFGDEIHRVSKLPEDFEELKKQATHLFENRLPELWHFQYINYNQSKITINDQKDYEELQKKPAVENQNSTTIKIYIEGPSDERQEERESVQNDISKEIEEKAGLLLKEENKEVQEVSEESKEVEPDIERGEKEISESEIKSLVEENISSIIRSELQNTPSFEVAADGKVLIDLKVLQTLMAGVMEKHLPQIIQKTKEALETKVQKKEEKDQEMEKIPFEESDSKDNESLFLMKQKAEKLHKCFPKQSFKMLLTYVSSAPSDLTLEELVENFKC